MRSVGVKDKPVSEGLTTPYQKKICLRRKFLAAIVNYTIWHTNLR